MKPLARTVRSAGVLTLVALLAACTALPVSPTTPGGISGMARIDENRYLLVRDLKGFESGPRLSVLELNRGEAYTVADVGIGDWRHPEGRPSDLEAACALPGRDAEFLLLESGHWEGRYGRLFRVRLQLTDQTYTAEVVHVYDLPEFDPKSLNDPGDEMEGLACALNGDGQVLVILGERGGSTAYPDGLLRWFSLDSASNEITWTPAGENGLAVNAPGSWQDPASNRDIAALHLAADGALWAAAAEDVGDDGPFRSVIYQIGEVRADRTQPLLIALEHSVHRDVAGFKIEGLAAGPFDSATAELAIGTEDEVFGGTWRPLR